MAKSILRLEAIKLREKGESVREIAKKLGVAKSSASLWTRHVILSIEQLEKLKGNFLKGGERGRTISSLNQKRARLLRIEQEKERGTREFFKLSPQELRIAGLCLYWAEGSKKHQTIVLCNSDPEMIKFFIKWLWSVYKIPKEELKCAVGINEAHRSREEIVKNYWSNLTGIPILNFTKTSFKKYPLRKVYDNFNDHYGTLAIKLSKPGRIYNRVLGEIYGLIQALNSSNMPG